MTELNLKRIMKSKGIGNKALSEMSGVPLGTLNKIIYGETTNPTLDNMRAIAKVLGCTLDDFYDDGTGYKYNSNKTGYYVNEEVAAYAQEIYDNPDLRILLDASRDVSKEDLELITEMVKKLKKTNNE